jgi:hypothetical protein
MGGPIIAWVNEEKAGVKKMIDEAVGKLSAAGLKTEAVMKVEEPKRLLIADAESWGNEETNEFKTAEDGLREARVRWRTFDLDTVRKQADGAVIKGTKVKDGLLKRLGAE